MGREAGSWVSGDQGQLGQNDLGLKMHLVLFLSVGLILGSSCLRCPPPANQASLPVVMQLGNELILNLWNGVEEETENKEQYT